MSATNEWREWHLTPAGWQPGSSRKNLQPTQQVAAPADRMVSKVYREYGAGKITRTVTLAWTAPDSLAVARLLQQYGETPPGETEPT